MPHREITQELLDQVRKKVSEMPPLPFPSVIRSETAEQIGFPNTLRALFTDTSDPEDRMTQIEKRLDAIELKLSPRPSLLILGDSVITEWQKLTENKRG